MADRKDLETKASEFKIQFTTETSDDDLKELITEAEENANVKEKENDPEYLKSELKKVISQRDRAKSDKRKFESMVQELKDKIGDAPNSEELESLKTQLEELKQYKEELIKKKEEEELSSKDEIERVKYQKNKEMKELEENIKKEKEELKKMLEKRNEDLELTKKEISLLRQKRLEAEIVTAASQNKAFNPLQIFRMTKDDFSYNENLDRFEYISRNVKGEIKDEKTVDEFIKDFLKDENNANLVRTSTKTDEGFKTRTDTSVKNTNFKTDDKEVDSDYVKKLAEMRNMSIEDVTEIEKLRLEKMKKIKAKK